LRGILINTSFAGIDFNHFLVGRRRKNGQEDIGAAFEAMHSAWL
jgi:hypothetical protein